MRNAEAATRASRDHVSGASGAPLRRVSAELSAPHVVRTRPEKKMPHRYAGGAFTPPLQAVCTAPVGAGARESPTQAHTDERLRGHHGTGARACRLFDERRMADTLVCHTPTEITRPTRATERGAPIARTVVRRTGSRPITRMESLDIVKRALISGTPTISCPPVPVWLREVPKVASEMEL